MKYNFICPHEFGTNHTSLKLMGDILRKRGHNDVRFNFSDNIVSLDDFTHELDRQYSSVDGQKIIVAPSMGGMIAINYAATRPKDLKGIVLLSTPEKFSEEQKEMNLRRLNTLDFRADADQEIDFSSEEYISLHPFSRPDFIARNKTPAYFQKMILLFNSFSSWNVRKESSSIGIPILSINYQRDFYIGKIHDHSTRGVRYMLTVGGIGHCPHIDHSLTVADAVEHYAMFGTKD